MERVGAGEVTDINRWRVADVVRGVVGQHRRRFVTSPSTYATIAVPWSLYWYALKQKSFRYLSVYRTCSIFFPKDTGTPVGYENPTRSRIPK